MVKSLKNWRWSVSKYILNCLGKAPISKIRPIVPNAVENTEHSELL